MKNNEKQFTQEQLLNYLREFSIKHKTNNISQKDINEDDAFPSAATFKRYFGSWGLALKCAELNPGIITGRSQDLCISINQEALEIINGELLGDGCLSLSGEYKSNACFSHSTSNINYGIYLYNKLEQLEVPLLKEEFLPARNNSKPQFRTRTTTNQYWTQLFYKWYPNGIKIVPSDIKLTKETCLHWYLGDGYFEDGTSKISTCGFTLNEIELLCNLLKNIGFQSTPNKRSGGYYIIRFSKSSYHDFLNWIGFCPIRGYEHRWGIIL